MSSLGNKKVLAKNLSFYIDRSGKDRKELAKAWGFPYSTVTEWINGRKYPRIDKIEIMADYFGIQKSDLIEERIDVPTVIPNGRSASDLGIMPVATKRFPVLGDIACGKPIMANEEKELYVEAGTTIDADFCLRAKGDSMVGARIYDGDIVFIRKQEMVDNGDIAAVIIEDEASLKRVNYFPEKNLLILKAENAKYEDLVYTGEELNHIRILGRAVAFQSDIR